MLSLSFSCRVDTDHREMLAWVCPARVFTLSFVDMSETISNSDLSPCLAYLEQTSWVSSGSALEYDSKDFFRTSPTAGTTDSGRSQDVVFVATESVICLPPLVITPTADLEMI